MDKRARHAEDQHYSGNARVFASRRVGISPLESIVCDSGWYRDRVGRSHVDQIHIVQEDLMAKKCAKGW